ncbi:MAG: hypothetical protein ACOYEF_00790 [Planifilum sp.]|jgi:hypothetical protein
MRRSTKERALVEQSVRHLSADPADKSGQGEVEIADEIGEPWPVPRLRKGRIR